MIVGFAGKKRSGKSTAAYALEEAGFELESFAITLKMMTRILLRDIGLNEDEIRAAAHNKEKIIPQIGTSYRKLLQTLGTDWGRKIHPDLWIMAAQHKAAMSFTSNIVFDDVRFENEAAWIRQSGGMIIHVISDRNRSIDHHESESGIRQLDGDVVVHNNGGIYDFLDEVFEIISNYRNIA